MEQHFRGFEMSHSPESEKQTVEIDIKPGTLVLMMGLPGSGKSTFASEHFPQESIVSTDALRGELTNNPENWHQSPEAFGIARMLVQSRLKRGKIAVLDAMNLKPNFIRSFLEVAKQQHAPIVAVHLNIDTKVLLDRNKNRMRDAEAAVFRKRRETDIKQIYKNPSIEQVHVITDPHAEVRVHLPEEEANLLGAEQDFYAVAHKAEADVLAYVETQRERKEASVPRIVVEPGSVNFLADSPDARMFLEQNTIGTQVLDLEFFSRRLGVDVNDEVLLKSARRLLSHRSELNLVSFVLVPERATQIGQAIKESLPEEIASQTMEQSSDVLRQGVLEVDRGDLPQEPLLVIGDVHGALSTIKYMHTQVAEEGREHPERAQRKMVFVGDIADRGPNNAQSVMAVAGLVKGGRAEWVLGNHDENLRKGLHVIQDAYQASGMSWSEWLKDGFKPELLKDTFRSRDTLATITELMGFLARQDKTTGEKKGERPFLTEHAFEQLIGVMDSLPVYKEWRDLVVVHAAMTRIPKQGEPLTDDERHRLFYGMKRQEGPISETLRLRMLTAKDPDRMMAGGHTHDPGVQVGRLSGTVGLDDNGPAIHGMMYPEMRFVSHEDPYYLELARMMRSPELPTGKKLLELVDYLEGQLMIETNRAASGTEYEGLTVISYHEITELKNLWNEYPVLRHFRGLILDKEGNVIARPFKKTHKAGVEIPLEELAIKPEKVFEKANGSLGICYFWKDKWRIATKFSFQNDAYTVPATRMLEQMNQDALKKDKTYLFEIILPNDSHVVDYKGQQQLVLLNAVETKTGVPLDWEDVEQTAQQLGTRTAEDHSAEFVGMTIAEIYEAAQTPGRFPNREGFMAVYRDQTTGEEMTVKVKSVEYDNKKFVRDRLDWKKIFEAYDWKYRRMPGEKREELLSYNDDNEYVNEAFQIRLDWIRTELDRLENMFFHKHADIIEAALVSFDQHPKLAKKERVEKAVRSVMKLVDEQSPLPHEKGIIFHYVRYWLTGEENAMGEYFKKTVIQRIDDELKKKGSASFWLVPDEVV